mmetsp:Transcript_1044/g.1754  ORF Transcript_1044/g.1754 Transcript_1044/m.1754 type:complete len:836 (+) Transcript_1044:578-3085(+)
MLREDEDDVVTYNRQRKAEETNDAIGIGPHASCSHSIGSDSEGAEVGAMDEEAPLYPMREYHFPVPFTKGVRCNPVTFFLGFAVLWGLAIWCMVDPEGSYENLTSAQLGVTRIFTWFYIVTTPIMFFFMAYVYIVHGNQKLGLPHEKPAYDAGSYFAMIFSAGVAVGLFFYGVGEPLYHLSGNRFDTGYHSDAEYDSHAINLTLFHWGLGAWTGYVLVGVTAAIAAYRENLPLTMRSCFYPILGKYTWGFWGDAVDAFSIVVVVAGVCTSLGLGAIQLIDGVNVLADLSFETGSDQENTARIICIWVVTAMATLSVVSGLDLGIKILSMLAIILGFSLWFLILFLDDTKYLLNVAVQSIGSYFQYNILQVFFATDAFAQLTRGNGRGIDGDQYQGLGATADWMNSWTIYYWAWWTAWASFVGLFIARISRGRTIREVINFTLAGPLVYAFFWFAVFGGAGLRAYRRALEVIQLGTFLGDPDMYLVPGSTECYNPPTDPITVTFIDKTGANATWDFVNNYPGISPVCTTISTMSWWNVLMQYYDYGYFLGWLAVAAIAIYFVTSADSGSLVVDHLASNGRDEEGFWIQRVFWACTEGAVATALLSAGKSDALSALQAAAIIAGLPFTVLLCSICICLYRFIKMDEEPEKYRSLNAFKLHFGGGVLNYFDLFWSFGGLFTHEERSFIKVPDAQTHLETLRAFVCPGWSTYIVMSRVFHKKKNMPVNILFTAFVQLFFFGWIGLFASVVARPGIEAFGWLCFFNQGFLLAILRSQIRSKYNILGNLGEDIGASLLAYYQVLAQMVIQTENYEGDESSAKSTSGGEGSESSITKTSSSV